MSDRGQGVALEAINAHGSEVVECQRQIGEMAKEADADVTPVHPGVDVLVRCRLDALCYLAFEEEREDEEKYQEEGEEPSDDGQDTFHAVKVSGETGGRAGGRGGRAEAD